jgi:hypothetical protein
MNTKASARRSRGPCGQRISHTTKADAQLSPSQAQTLSADDLARRTVYRRAVEAVVWGMPAVNYYLMYQEMVRKVKGDFNQSRPNPCEWR